jgi:hypothetical protein
MKAIKNLISFLNQVPSYDDDLAIIEDKVLASFLHQESAMTPRCMRKCVSLDKDMHPKFSKPNSQILTGTIMNIDKLINNNIRQVIQLMVKYKLLALTFSAVTLVLTAVSMDSPFLTLAICITYGLLLPSVIIKSEEKSNVE